MLTNTLARLILLAAIATPYAHAEILRINKVEEPKEQLIYSLLELALSKVDPNTTLKQLPEVIPVPRWASQTETGSLDLLWAGASKDLDQRFLTVRIPLLKGLLGHRVFIIRDNDQASFDQVTSLEDLKRLDAGMGAFWGSTKVLENAGLNVVKTVKYQNLFYMVDGERFDYFPRAVHEPWNELASRPDLNLSVEEKLLLVYPYAMYFYVRKDNIDLHKKLEKGLELAISDGSFDEIFFNNDLVKSALEKAQLGDRRVLRISNPDMHPDTPINRPELWLDISKL